MPRFSQLIIGEHSVVHELLAEVLRNRSFKKKN